MLVALSGAAAAKAPAALPRLADYGLRVGCCAGIRHGHVGEPADTPGTSGTWSVTDVRNADRTLVFHARFVPPAWSLPVDAGPALLFWELSLSGGRGEIGYQQRVAKGSIPVPGCAAERCAFEADVAVDLDRLPGIAKGVRGLGGPEASIGLGLVRTFAAGTWLQLLEAQGDGPRQTLRQPGDWSGHLDPVGLFPAATAGIGPAAAAIEAGRRTAGDVTHAVVSTPVRFIAGAIDWATNDPRGLETADGDRVVFDAATQDGLIDTTVELPVGTTWRVGHATPDATTFAVGAVPLIVVVGYESTDGGLLPVAVQVAEVVSSGRGTVPSPAP
ncbi:MAG: hypothetical protein LH650_12830 [Chloroflexi bacterium]|nr:hypothetical protein [Chloroflexota bacterium]